MDPVILALAPIFAAGLVIQQLLEVFDVPVGWVAGILPGDDKVGKSYLMSLLAFAGGFLVALGFQLHAFEILLSGATDVAVPVWMDVIATALIISGGTEGTNSIVKFLGYTKEKNKGEAAKETGRSVEELDGLHQ